MDSRFAIHEVRWTPDKVQRLWAYFANTPDADRKYFGSHSGDAVLDFLQMHVQLDRLQVLDYGCGPGFLCERLLKRGIRTKALEFSVDSFQKVQQRCYGHPLFGGAILAEGIPTPIADATLDVVLFVEVIEHLLPSEVLPTVLDLHRILKPGGFLLVTSPNNENLDLVKTMCPDCGCIFHPWQHVNSFSPAGLSSLFEEHAFQKVVCQATTFGMGHMGRAIRFLRRSLLGKQSLEAEPHLVFIGRKIS